MDTLVALFGSQTKIKILRLFLLNPGVPFFAKEISGRTKCTQGAVNKELENLCQADIVKKKTVSKQIKIGRGKKAAMQEVKSVGYILSETFPYLEELKALLVDASIRADESFVKRFAFTGKIKLLVAAGVFIHNWDSRVDLLIVGDDLNLDKIESAIEVIEAEVGKEIAYSALATKDFEYRFNIHDRLVRDTMDYPHVTLVDKLGVETS